MLVQESGRTTFLRTTMRAADETITVAPHLDVMVADGHGMFCVLVDEYLRLLGFTNVYLATSEELSFGSSKGRDSTSFFWNLAKSTGTSGKTSLKQSITN